MGCRRKLLLAVLIAASSAAGVSERDFIRIPELPQHFTVNGDPVMGTFSVHTVAGLEEVKAAGMNLVIGSGAVLDTSTEEGAFCRANGIKVMCEMTGYIYGTPRTGAPIDASQDSIPLVRWERPLPDTGVVQIDDERIRYEGYSPTALLNCRRGYDGTEPAGHKQRVILFWPYAAAEGIEAVKDSPNLWGYYVLDDTPGDALSALRALYRVVKQVDGDDHPVCALYGGPRVLHNFGPGMCDLLLLSRYPFFENEYDRNYICHALQYMLAECRRQVPGIPYIAVYQSFWGIPSWTADTLRPWQLREQIEDFAREGACGFIAFNASSRERGRDWDGWNTREPLIAELRALHDEVRETGGLLVAPEPDTMAAIRLQPKGHWEVPREVPGLVPAWYVTGPFADSTGAGLDAVFPPEAGVDIAAEYDGKLGRVRWTPILAMRVRDFLQNTDECPYPLGRERELAMNNTVVYATCVVSSRDARQANMLLGCDDAAQVWFDGREVWRCPRTHGYARDDHIVPVELPAGETRILVKVWNGLGNFAMSMRFTDGDGAPLSGLEFSPARSEALR